MDLLERNIKKGDTEEEKARKEEERKEQEVGEWKTKTQDQEPQQQGQGLSLSLANGSARYLASLPHLSEAPRPAPPCSAESREGSASPEWFAAVWSLDMWGGIWIRFVSRSFRRLPRAFPPFLFSVV